MKSRGVITLVFDDGYEDVYQEVIPLLASYNIPAVFAVPVHPEHQQIAGAHIRSVEDWVSIVSQYHHEIAAHGVTHQSLSKLPAQELDQELQQSQQVTGATTLVYPGGAYDENVLQAVSQHFLAARTVRFGMETILPASPYELKTINYTKQNFSVARANTYALKACIQHKWLIETFHMVRSQHSDMKHFTFIDDFASHLDFITSLPVSIQTIKQVIS